jgi:hypothetical protein
MLARRVDLGEQVVLDQAAEHRVARTGLSVVECFETVSAAG